MIFLMDMSQLVHQYWHVRSVDDGYDVAERTLHRMEKLRAHFGTIYPDCAFVAVFDNPERTLYRTILFPEYKGDRTKDSGLRDVEYATFQAVSNDQDWRTVVAPQMFEADDVMATLARHHKGKVLIHSQDRDCHSMLVDGRVSIIKKSNTPEPGGPLQIEYMTAKQLSSPDEFGFDPSRWVDYQILVGGKDNVPGWDGVGEKAAKRILENYAELSNVTLDDPDLKLNARQRESYAEFCERLPTLRMVRTLYANLEWPENVPYLEKQSA